MPSTLTIDGTSLKAILDAYVPGGSLAVGSDGKLTYTNEDSGFAVALSSLSAGGTVTYNKLKITIAKLEMSDGGIAASFAVK